MRFFKKLFKLIDKDTFMKVQEDLLAHRDLGVVSIDIMNL